MSNVVVAEPPEHRTELHQSKAVRNTIIAFFASAVAATGLIVEDVIAWAEPVEPAYVVFDDGAKPHRVAGLHSPVLDRNDIIAWTTKWVVAPYNINFHDYIFQRAQAAPHYTSEGWQNFTSVFKSIGNLDRMTGARLTCYAQPMRGAVGKPVTSFTGEASYEVQVPIVQTCENVNEEHTQKLMITATVIRVANRQHPDGLAIERLVTKVK